MGGREGGFLQKDQRPMRAVKELASSYHSMDIYQII